MFICFVYVFQLLHWFNNVEENYSRLDFKNTLFLWTAGLSEEGWDVTVFLHKKLRKCSFIMKQLTVFIWVTAVIEFWRNSRWDEIVSNAAKAVRWSRCWFFVFVVTLVVVILSWWDVVFYDVIIGHFGWCYQIIVNCCVFFWYTTRHRAEKVGTKECRRLPRLHHQNVCCMLVTNPAWR